LERFGYALRLRWLWLRKTDPSRPWLHLNDEREPMVKAMFQASVYLEIGDGATALFWSDRWLQGASLQELAPCLCKAVSSRVRAQRTVAQALSNRQWIKDISRALTVQVLFEYLQTWDRMQLIHLNANPDRVCWKWTADQRFTTASAYQSFFVGQHPIKGARFLCKTSAPPKCKFFIWLAFHDRCWTVQRRKKRNLQADDPCAFCDQESETIDHLLVSCVFARQIWSFLLHRLGWDIAVPSTVDQSLADWWFSAHKRIAKADRKCFDSMVVLTCWWLWKERNRRTFDHQAHSTTELLALISDEVVCWFHAGYQHLYPVAAAFGRTPGREMVSM